MDAGRSFDLVAYYDDYPRIEEQFQSDLDKSLRPRGPGMLYDLVRQLNLPPGAAVLDVGCGEGGQALKLARELGFTVHGLDPAERHVGLAKAELATAEPQLRERVSFTVGSAGELPASDRSIDLIWCRDVLVHVEDLDRAYLEFRRVLRDGGRVLVYQMFGTKPAGAS